MNYYVVVFLVRQGPLGLEGFSKVPCRRFSEGFLEGFSSKDSRGSKKGFSEGVFRRCLDGKNSPFPKDPVILKILRSY